MYFALDVGLRSFIRLARGNPTHGTTIYVYWRIIAYAKFANSQGLQLELVEFTLYYEQPILQCPYVYRRTWIEQTMPKEPCLISGLEIACLP